MLIRIPPFSTTLLLSALLALPSLPAARGETRVTPAAHHGWSEAFALANGQVEAIIVPAIGRVMQFRFTGEKDGPFWENRSLDGRPADSQSSEWINFGGDKTWPSPQGDWPKITGRGWPPPKAFDSLPVAAQIRGAALVLTSKIDPHYGIQTERIIRLHPDRPEMTIETTYRKKEGPPVQAGIWIITQLNDPEKIYMPLPQKTLFPEGWNKQSAILPANLKLQNGVVTCTRSPKDSTKIGSDASVLIWGGPRHIVEILAPREPSGEFPDQQSSAEIYTNPDPNPYVELEMLGPLSTLKIGDAISRSQTYRLHRRNSQPLDEQVRALLKAR